MNFSSSKETESKNTTNPSGKFNICLVRGTGSTVCDASDRSYLDLTGCDGENILGYGHPSIKSAIVAQTEKILSVSGGMYNELYSHLAAELTDGTVFDKALITDSAASSLRETIATIKAYYAKRGQKKKILAVCNEGNAAGNYNIHLASPDFKFTPPNDFEKFRKNLTDDIGAVFLQPYQPESGSLIAKYDFLINVYALCKSKGVLLVIDEFVSGVGRTGFMFSYDSSGIKPDITILSRGLGGGIPISAMLAGGEAAYYLSKNSDSFSPSFLLGCATAQVVLKELKNGLLDQITEIGNYFKAKLFKLSKFEFVKEIRGIGLLLSLEFDNKVSARGISQKLTSCGLLTHAPTDNIIVLSPPYIITRKEIDGTVEILSTLFSGIN